MATETINAIQVHAYGDADQLKLERIARPEPQEGEVLVQVYAAGVNPVDWKFRKGWLKDFRPMTFPYIPGADLAGVVEKVGPGVTAFQPGQEVFGSSLQGSYTEYAIAPANALALKPKKLSFDETATIPIGASTAWQGIFDHGHLQPDQRVLILGGAGGVGLFAVQLARRIGAHVISTASTRNLDFVRSLGAETVVDYTKEHVEEVVYDVDLIFDTVGGQVLTGALSALKPGGTPVTIIERISEAAQAKASELGVQPVSFSAQFNSDLLNTFARLIDEGQIKVHVGHTFPLSEAAQAQELSEKGHGRGRIVLHMA
jgi:NADPH:quinone reductase-like Zn-dependent oxidoreductase